MSSGGSQDFGDRLFTCCHDDSGALDQAWPEQIVGNVSRRLHTRADCEPLRHHAEAETGDLGKDELHPEGSFAAVRQLLDDPAVHLCVDETAKVERIGQATTPSLQLPALSWLPDSP